MVETNSPECQSLLDAVKDVLSAYENCPYTYEDAYYQLKKQNGMWSELKTAFLKAGGVADYEVMDIWK
jgi:hypothetical protein